MNKDIQQVLTDLQNDKNFNIQYKNAVSGRGGLLKSASLLYGLGYFPTYKESVNASKIVKDAVFKPDFYFNEIKLQGLPFNLVSDYESAVAHGTGGSVNGGLGVPNVAGGFAIKTGGYIGIEYKKGLYSLSDVGNYADRCVSYIFKDFQKYRSKLTNKEVSEVVASIQFVNVINYDYTANGGFLFKKVSFSAEKTLKLYANTLSKFVKNYDIQGFVDKTAKSLNRIRV